MLACLLVLSLSGLAYVAISRRQSHGTFLSILLLTIFVPSFHNVPSHRCRSCAVDEYSSKYHFVLLMGRNNRFWDNPIFFILNLKDSFSTLRL